MKNILIVLTFLLNFNSCDIPEEKWVYQGDITTFRIDDDGEYHFSTDNRTYNDESQYRVTIERKDINKPELYTLHHKCPEGKICSEGTNEWREAYKIKIILPNNYKIETFDD